MEWKDFIEKAQKTHEIEILGENSIFSKKCGLIFRKDGIIVLDNSDNKWKTLAVNRTFDQMLKILDLLEN